MPITPEQYDQRRQRLEEDAIDAYYIAIDETEVFSILFEHGRSFPTFEEAEAKRRTYDWLNDFHIYHVMIKPVAAPEND